MPGKQIKPNKHINWAEKSQNDSWKQGDWKIQGNHACFLLERGWDWESWYPQRQGAKSGNMQHTLPHGSPLRRKSYSRLPHSRELMAPEPLQRGFTPCPLQPIFPPQWLRFFSWNMAGYVLKGVLCEGQSGKRTRGGKGRLATNLHHFRVRAARQPHSSFCSYVIDSELILIFQKLSGSDARELRSKFVTHSQHTLQLSY